MSLFVQHAQVIEVHVRVCELAACVRLQLVRLSRWLRMSGSTAGSSASGEAIAP